MHPPSTANPLAVAGITFLLAADADRYRATGIPLASEPENDPGARMVAQALMPAANDSLSDLVIVGWARGAVDLVLTDACLNAKSALWVVDEGQLPYLAAALTGRGERIRVAVCTQPEHIPYILSQSALCWSFAALDARLGRPDAILRQAWNRFVRTFQSPERVIGDLRHLLHRLDRLDDAVPLGAWHNHYVGETALCLAAGPSLDLYLDQVRAIQHRCVVIVVDVIQKRIQAAGIKVDFVLNVDTCSSLTKLMAPSPDPDTVLVLPLVGHRDLDLSRPRRSYFSNETFSDWLLGDGIHTFDKGTTVGIASVGFARFLGCGEVVLMGHDLAFRPDAYYSNFVDRSSHEANMVALSSPTKRMIPGNDDGKPVCTDRNFQIAVEDLTLLLRRWGDVLTAYNPNINHRVGARIDGTIALPDFWEPRRTTALPRPATHQQLGAGIAVSARNFAERFRTQAKSAAEFWREQRAANPVQFSHIATPPSGDLHFSLSYLVLFDRGALYHMLRLHALPPSITVADHHRELEDFVAAAIDAGIALLDRCLDLAQEPLPEKPIAPHETGLTQALFNALFRRIALDDEFSMDAAMMPAVASNYLALRLVLPELGLPAPHSANEGLRLSQALGLFVPRRFLVQTLCLCALENERWYGPCLDWGRESGLLGTERLTGHAAHGQTDDGELWLSASEAVLRLRHDTSADLTADAERALTWHPCRLHLLRTLLDRKGDALLLLERLVRDGRIPLDDQLGALLLLNHPDHARAVQMLTPYMKSLGEATVMAIAHRELVRGNHQGALAQVAGIRQLSRFRDQALTIACRSHLATGKIHLVSECAEQIVDPKLRAQWARFLPEGDEPS